MSEKQFLQQIRQLARVKGWTTYHALTSKGSELGFPDLVLLRPPTLYFVELKTAQGQPTAAQRTWLDELGKVDIVKAALWRPDDWPTIVEALD